MTDSNIEYGEETQRVLLAFMLSDPDLYARSRGIVKDVYFDDALRPAVRYIQEYSDQYSALPLPSQVKAQTNVSIDHLTDIADAHHAWYLATVEKFCRYRAIEDVVLEGPELLRKGEAAEIERRLKDAMIISLTSDLGSVYFDDPMARLERIRDKSNFVSTGWASIDKLLNGGFTAGSLNIFCGGSGSGKSLWMQNIALNWVEAGKNVVYFTLELAEDLTDARVDQMVTGMSRHDMLVNIEETAMRIRAKGRTDGMGTLTTKKYSESGTTANDLRAYIKEYTIKRGYAPDAICVDYLDLMYPNNAKVDPSNLFVKDKYVAEELRAIAGDLKIPLVTASQLNRGAVQESEFDHSHIAGGISKINTADNVFAILFNNTMREAGRYQLQFIKTRSAAAVGMRIDMKFNKVSLRIEDGDNEEERPRENTPQALREELKSKTASTVEVAKTATVDEEPSSSPMRASMKSLLADIKKGKAS